MLGCALPRLLRLLQADAGAKEKAPFVSGWCAAGLPMPFRFAFGYVCAHCRREKVNAQNSRPVQAHHEEIVGAESVPVDLVLPQRQPF
jgi:hypothetical protein